MARLHSIWGLSGLTSSPPVLRFLAEGVENAAVESVDTADPDADMLDAEATSPRIEGMKNAPVAQTVYGAPSNTRQGSSRWRARPRQI